LTAFKPAESGPEEVRVTTNIVRRRSRPSVPESEVEAPVVVEPVAAPPVKVVEKLPLLFLSGYRW
jgi:translation initiation factor IF-2